MASPRTGFVLHQLCQLTASRTTEGVPDQLLLERFVASRDEDAFTALVHRHGPMVVGVCRRLLSQTHDAEDAFQATFLVLARKAASIRKGASVGSWLHGVAVHVARKSRLQASRRRLRERGRAVPAVADAGDAITWGELRFVLDEELARLPRAWRAPLILCYLEGQTQDEAARRLGLSKSTFRRRLERGRGVLQTRLARRGVTLSAGLFAALLSESSASAALSKTWSLQTVKTALLFRDGQWTGTEIVTKPVAMANSALKSLVLTRFKSVALLLLTLSFLTGLGLCTYLVVAERVAEIRGPESPPHAANEKSSKAAAASQSAVDQFGDPLPPRALARMGTIRFRHGDQVEAMSLSPDGRTLATASRDETVCLWDMATGQEVRRLPDHQGSLRFLAFSRDGKLFASGASPSGIIRVWDTATWGERRQLRSPFTWIGHVSFSPDGKILAASANRHRIFLWETTTGRLLHELDGQEESSFAGPIAFSPDGRMLLSGGLGETLRLGNVITGKEQRRFLVQPPWPKEKTRPPHYYGLSEVVAYSPDGRLIASAALHTPVRIWNATTGKEIRPLRGDNSGAFSLAFSPDGNLLVSGESTGMVRFWEIATGKEVRRLAAHRTWVSGLAFARDGQTLVTSGDSTIRVWQVRTGTEMTPDRGHSAGITSSIVSPDQRTLATGGADNTIRHWDLATGKELRRFVQPVSSRQGIATFSPDGKIAATFKSKMIGDNTAEVGIAFWDLATQQERALLWRPNIFAALFSPDGKTLFTQSWDVAENAGLIRLWDVATGKELRVLARVPDGFGNTDLSPDGHLLAGIVHGRECAIYVWEVATSKLLRRFPGDPEFNQSLAFSPDSKLLAMGDGPRPRLDSRVMQHHIHLWDLTTGKELRKFGCSSSGYWPLLFSADGNTLATADQDNRIHLWEVATGSERLRLAGHRGRIQRLLFAERSRTLVSASEDTTALVWDLTGRQKARDAANKPLTPAELDASWTELAGEDAVRAYASIWKLVASPAQTVPYVRAHLQPVPAEDENHVGRLIADLDNDEFKIRERATAELDSLSEDVLGSLQKALKNQPTPEARRRLQALIEKQDQRRRNPSTDRLRALRAIELLELAGTPDARQLLEKLAHGADGARLTQEARAALERLARGASIN
jgi:RNA polymerase sigma factor (sigma-70 family)